MTLNEAYDLIDGKYVKAENNFYHYVGVDKFHNMVKKGVIFSGNYPANTYGYGKNKKSGEELCLVRSDRRPDLVKNLNLSGSVGDIKIFFNEDNLKNDFGKPKNIDEYPIQGLQYMKNNLIPKLKKQIIIPAPKANSLLDDLNKNFYKWDKETTKQKIEMLNKFIKITKEDKSDILYCQDQYNKTPEHMESRIQLKDKRNLPLTTRYVQKILIPDYLKNEKQVLEDLKKLKVPYQWYITKYPKEKKGTDY